jgi:hypothetical protein
MTIKTATAAPCPNPEIDLPPLSPDRAGWPLDAPLADYLDEVLPDAIKFESVGRQLAEDLGSLDL